MNSLTIVALLLLLIFFLWFFPVERYVAVCRLSHLRQPDPAQELHLQLGLIEAQGVTARFEALERLDEYKFFTALVVSLLDYARKYGASITGSVKELRQGLSRDIAREREIRSLWLAGYIQFAIVSAVTWSFVILSQVIAGISAHSFALILIASLQLVGCLCFKVLAAPIRRRYFGELDQFIRCQYSFKGLCGAGLSAGLIIKKSGLSELLQGEYKRELSILKRRLFILIQRWKQTGVNINADWDDALTESWSLHQLYFGQYLKAMEALKFGLLAIFYLSSYFIFIASLFLSFFGPA